MLKSYLKVAFRTLMRFKGFTALTVLGLALSMAVCLLILTFVWDQKSYDRFHAHGDRIVRILSDQHKPDGDVDRFAATPAPLADAVQEEVPGIEAATRIGQIRSLAIVEGGSVAVEGLYAEPSFFDVFSFEVEHGDGTSILNQPNQLILSHDAARSLFGDVDPIGKAVQLEGEGDFIVGGILAPPAGKSHLRFDVLASFSTLATEGRQAELNDWMNYWRFATYLLVDDQQVVDRLEAALPEISRRAYAGETTTLDFHVQRLHDIALGPALGNEISTYSMPRIAVYFLGVLGLIIMLAAGINYVSLSVARSMRRAREVGVRKAMGAGRRQVIFQFLAEGVVVALLALTVAYLLLLWLIPAFNGLSIIQMADIHIEPSFLFKPGLIGTFVLFSVVVGLLAGVYPAFRLSRFKPAAVLKGLRHTRGFSGTVLRHSLTGIQLGLAVIFVTTTAVLLDQFNYMLTADYGFAQEDILNVNLQGQPYDVFREEMLRQPDVVAVSATSTLPASGSVSTTAAQREGMDRPIRIFEYDVDPGFVQNLDLHLLAGRDFSPEIASDSTQAAVLNETAVRGLGLGTPAAAVGSMLDVGPGLAEGNDGPVRSYHIIGVVQDYQYNMLTDPIDAMVLRYRPDRLRYANVRVRPGRLDAVEAHLEQVWHTLAPTHPIDYARFDVQLTDNPFTRLLKDVAWIVGVVTFLAMVISCLGLLGMALYTVETRVKEVGLRKVMGAGRRSIVLLLSGQFVRLLAVAGVAALPLAWFGNRLWLQAFANHVEPSMWLFVGCAMVVSLVALAIVSTQTLRAAAVNPVECLRYE